MSNFLSKIFGWLKKSEPAPVQPAAADLSQLLQRAAESILENESLTADLDDSAAKELLDWGLACAKRVAQEAAGFEAAAVETTLSTRLQATRRLMRAVTQWIAGQQDMDAASSSDALSKIMEQAAVVYGRSFTPPATAQYTAFLASQTDANDSPQQMIARLRALIEK